MIPGVQPKLELAFENFTEKVKNWELVRERDGLTKQSKEVKWIEWDKNLLAKKLHRSPKVGYSLVMSPFNRHFTWQTTEVVEIIEEKEGYVKFKTRNSAYELKKLVKK